MKPPRGAYKISNRGIPGSLPVFDAYLDPLTRSDLRTQRLLQSLRSEILEGGGGGNLRIRQVVANPRELFRVEIELPELGYQRTTLLDRATLEELLAEDDVRAVVETSALLGG